MSSIICYLVSKKLDQRTYREWKSSITDLAHYPTYSSLEKFLIARSFSLEDAFPSDNKDAVEQRKVGKKSAFVNTAAISCPICKGTHGAWKCKEFLELNPRDRYEVVKQRRLCWKCLNQGHGSSDCRFGNCAVCDRPHHRLLHRETKEEKSRLAEPTEPSECAEATV